MDTSGSGSERPRMFCNVVVLEKISWTNHVTNVEALQTVENERNILQTIKKKEG